MCKSNLFRSYKSDLNKNLRGKVILREEQPSIKLVVDSG